jgi:hypothetical protein
MFVDNDVVKSVDNFGVMSVDICVGLVVVDIFVRWVGRKATDESM